jgi:GNAT superfamily N-acetyltransferase
MASKHMRFFVLEHAASVVGFYALRRQDRETMELEALFVEPGFIGQGFGRALIEHAKSIASGMGAIRLIIQGDPSAEGFYVAVGSVLTGRKESGSIPGRFLPTFAIDLSGNHAA